MYLLKKKYIDKIPDKFKKEIINEFNKLNIQFKLSYYLYMSYNIY
jgi:hypothetical protein